MLTIFTVTILEAILEAIAILGFLLWNSLIVLLSWDWNRAGAPIIVLDGPGLVAGLARLILFLGVVQF